MEHAGSNTERRGGEPNASQAGKVNEMINAQVGGHMAIPRAVPWDVRPINAVNHPHPKMMCILLVHVRYVHLM